MKIKEVVKEDATGGGTSSGSVAAVVAPLGGKKKKIIKRVKETDLRGWKRPGGKKEQPMTQRERETRARSSATPDGKMTQRERERRGRAPTAGAGYPLRPKKDQPVKEATHRNPMLAQFKQHMENSFKGLDIHKLKLETGYNAKGVRIGFMGEYAIQQSADNRSPKNMFGHTRRLRISKSEENKIKAAAIQFGKKYKYIADRVSDDFTFHMYDGRFFFVFNYPVKVPGL